MKRNLTVGVGLALVSIAAGAALLLLGGCQTLLNIENPRYSIRDIRPRVDVALPLSASTIDIDFAVEVDNPNPVGLRLDQVDFDLLINGNHVLDTISQQNVRIPANGIGTVQLETRIGYQNIRNIWDQILDVVRGNRARYEIRGTAHYDTPMGRLQFPVTIYSSR
jgi:LEA14-like dessication related protein